MKKLIVACMMLMTAASFGQQALGEVQGYLKNSENKEGIFDAHVFINDQDRVYQVKTSFDGSFRISAIPAGEYLVNIRVGNDTIPNIAITVPMDGIARMGDILYDVVQKIPVMKVNADRMRLIDGNLPVRTISAEDIEQSAARFDAKAMIAGASSDVRLTEDGELVFRGARKGDMLYIIDGIKGSEVAPLPSCSIGSMMIYTGGLPAKYGDTTGGVVVVETKSYFDLYRAWVGQQIREGKM